MGPLDYLHSTLTKAPMPIDAQAAQVVTLAVLWEICPETTREELTMMGGGLDMVAASCQDLLDSCRRSAGV